MVALPNNKSIGLQMTDEQLLICELAGRFMTAYIEKEGWTCETDYAVGCFDLAKTIVLKVRDFK